MIDNITFGLEIQGVSENEREKRGKKALEMVGLNGQAYKRIYDYQEVWSSGLDLRELLFSAEQEILLMDEPFSALDPLIEEICKSYFLILREKYKKQLFL